MLVLITGKTTSIEMSDTSRQWTMNLQTRKANQGPLALFFCLKYSQGNEQLILFFCPIKSQGHERLLRSEPEKPRA